MLALAAPLLDANPIEEPIKWIVGSIGRFLGQSVTTSTVTDPLRVLVPLGDPSTALDRNPLARIVWGGSDFNNIANSIKAIGYLLFAILLVARMLKLAATGRLRSPEHLLFDLAPKLVLGMVAIEYFDQALNLLGRLSMWGAFLLEDALLFPIHRTAANMLTAFPTQGLGGLLMPILYVLVAYLVLLVVTSRLVLLLGALISPLGIPVALYNQEGRLAGTWIRMIVSGLLVPVVAGIGTAGSLALAWLVHQITGNGPYLGSYLGALTGECGLFFTAFATTAMFKDAVKQGMAGVRGSFEGTQMGSVGGAPRDALDTAVRAAEAAALVGAMAAAPEAAPAAAGAVKRGGSRPEADTGESGPPILRLPGGAPEITAGPKVMLPAPRDPGPGSQLMLPAPSSPSRPPTDLRQRRVEGGKEIWEVEQVVHYARHLSEPAGDILDATELAQALEA
ncbi:MAG: hypothetical protein J2P43_15940 [Candidatus Dormibacteraeota bacterium]|nr:hypothetical protein [Candidatus Dormibacteraeota bacterium]